MEEQGEQRRSVTAEVKAQAGSHTAVLSHQRQLGVSSCPLQPPGPRATGGSALEGELGESCWVSEGRRGRQGVKLEFSIAVVLFCGVREVKQPQQDQANIPERASRGKEDMAGGIKSHQGMEAALRLVCPASAIPS